MILKLDLLGKNKGQTPSTGTERKFKWRKLFLKSRFYSQKETHFLFVNKDTGTWGWPYVNK